MSSRYLFFILSIWLSCLLGNLKAANIPFANDVLSQSPVSFSYLTIDEGLSSNTVRALMQDRKGFVWIGTSRGLNRFDGHRVVRLHKTRSLSITALAEDGDNIWVGTENGLYLYYQRTDSIRKYALRIKERLQSMSM